MNGSTPRSISHRDLHEPTHKLLREPLQQLASESVLIGTSSWKYPEDLPTQAKISKDVIALHMRILVKSGQPLKASYLGENICFGDPDNVRLNIEVGQLKHDAGEFTNALKWLMSVESKCRDSAHFYLLRAKCHASLGDLEACVLTLREAHKIDPDLRMQSMNDPAFEAIYGADPNQQK